MDLMLKIQYDNEGNATVVLPNGTIATIPASDLFKTPEDAKKANGGDDINKPNYTNCCSNKNALTPMRKKAIEDKVKAVNPGAVVTVDEKRKCNSNNTRRENSSNSSNRLN